MVGSLQDKKVLITRNKSQAEPFAELLQKEGADPVILPLLSFAKLDTKENFNRLERLHEYSWLFFTSANGVEFFFDLMYQWKFQTNQLATVSVASVGRKTTTALNRHGIEPDFQPTEFNGAVMAKEFLDSFPEPDKILLVQGKLSRREISSELVKQQVLFHQIVVYDTLINERYKKELNNHIRNDDIDIYTFTSPSTVRAFEQLVQESTEQKALIKKERLCVCIGETTREAAKEAGFLRLISPAESTVEGMVEMMKKQVGQKG